MKLWGWIAWGTLCGAWLFVAGLLIGREIPVHRYERLGNSNYLLDVSTGSVCSAFGSNNIFDHTTAKDVNGFDLANQGATDTTPSGAKSIWGGSTVPPCK